MRGKALQKLPSLWVNVLITGFLVVAMALSVAGVALAAWSDVTPALVAPYGFTEEDLAAISQGYDDGSWKPQSPMLRKHFVKMALGALGIAQATPAQGTFSDVAPIDPYYPYVEGAALAELTTGVGGGKFGPNVPITREQAVAMIARWLAGERGVDLESEYDTQTATAVLGYFSDAGSVAPTLRDELAYAVDESIVKGSLGQLEPKKTLTRIQGAAMLLRAAATIEPTTTTSGSTTSSTGTSSTTTTTAPSTTTTSTSSTSTTSSSTTTSTSSSTTSTTAASQPQTLFGGVKKANSASDPVPNATVTVTRLADNVVLGSDTTDSGGLFSIDMTGVPLGTGVQVSVLGATLKPGYAIYGDFDEKDEEVWFDYVMVGVEEQDRRVPGDTGAPPPPPFEGLLPE